MRKVIAITNRHLVHRDYWDQLEQIVASPVESLVLREKISAKMNILITQRKH